MSLYMAVFFGTTPIGAPVIGLLADEFGPRAALVIPGVASLIVTGLLVTAYRAARSAEGVRAAPSTNPISASPAPAITR